MSTLKERFQAKLGTKNPSTGCIPWTACLNAYGYGKIWTGNGHTLAHRLAYEMTHGPIPDGVCVLHECDNRACCNTEHLFLGSHDINMADRNNKGRQARQIGEANPRAKLSEKDVLEIKRRLSEGEMPKRISDDFNIGRSAVCQIQLGRNWSHL